MDSRLLLHHIDFKRKVFQLDGKDYEMRDCLLPTIDRKTHTSWRRKKRKSYRNCTNLSREAKNCASTWNAFSVTDACTMYATPTCSSMLLCRWMPTEHSRMLKFLERNTKEKPYSSVLASLSVRLICRRRQFWKSICQRLHLVPVVRKEFSRLRQE